jgi:hypothetical protein
MATGKRNVATTTLLNTHISRRDISQHTEVSLFV